MPARVLTVDDNSAFLGVLRVVVRATGHLCIAGEASSGEQAVAVAQALCPDVVLMDVWMPGIDGIKAAERIKAARPATLIILISTTHPDELPQRSLDRCADAVIWKSRLDPRTLDELWLRHCRGGPP
jgi:two-component system, NarL family, invasion response regulator UvrY